MTYDYMTGVWGMTVDFETLKFKVDLLAIVEADLGQARRRCGRWYQFVCPFHADSEHDDGSLRVTPDTGKWFCFGCHKSGDAVDWLVLRQGLSIREACQRLGADATSYPARDEIFDGMVLRTIKASVTDPPCENWQQAAERVVKTAQDYLWSAGGEPIRERLLKRGLRGEALRAWQIGYNPGHYFVPGIKANMAAGIVIPARVGGKLWGVKVRQPDGYNPKYRSLAGGKAILFGADTLKLPVALLCEGEFDAILAWQEAGDLVGIASTSGGAGTWQKHWNVYLLGAQKVFVAYDSDATGQAEAAKVVAQIGGAQRVNVPVGKDITEYWQQGGDVRAWVQSLIG